jgi:oligopeptide transport system permease protein
MGRYIVVRTIWILIIISIILSLNFVLLKIAPEYPPPTEDEKSIYYARQVTDGYMTVRVVEEAAEVAAITTAIETNTVECSKCYYKPDDVLNPEKYWAYEPVPLSHQYFRWVGNIITDWNWGYSTRVKPNTAVFDVLIGKNADGTYSGNSRIATTLKLNLIALFFYIPIGFILGIIAALYKNSWLDNMISLLVMFFISVPSFVVMTMMVMVFGFQLQWVPDQWPPSFLATSVQLKALILPVLGLSFGAIAGLTRTTRAELTEVLTSEFLLLARTKGLTRTQAVIRHAMRNSMVPLVPGIIGSFVFLLSGSVIIEKIYGIPGTGLIYLDAMTEGQYDFNLVLGITAFYTIISLFAVLLVDLSYGIVDPRIRMGARR